jgi:hypothetical protein
VAAKWRWLQAAIFLSLSFTSSCFFFSSFVFLFFFLSVGWPERPLCNHPKTALGVHPLFFHHVAGKWEVLSASFWSFQRKREWAKQGRKVFFFPYSLRVQGKKKTYGAVQNNIVLLLFSFFFFEMYETTPFFPKRVFSFKWKLAPKHIRFKIRPSICTLFHFGPWFRISSIKSPIGHQTSIFYAIKPLI